MLFAVDFITDVFIFFAELARRNEVCFMLCHMNVEIPQITDGFLVSSFTVITHKYKKYHTECNNQ